MTQMLQAIASIRTPYKQKFAIPRQPGLVNSALGKVEFTAEFSDPNYLRGIEQFSHLWLIFQFHHTTEQGWSPMVRPPRLGGNTKVGVFATRSPFRPNNMGLSVVKFVDVEYQKGQLVLVVSGMDLLDGTPILDIKPYVPYADSLPHACGGFAQFEPQLMAVDYTAEANKQLSGLQGNYPNLKSLITEVLAQDPRPAFKTDNHADKSYGMNLYDLNIRWKVINGTCLVDDISHV